MSSVGEYERAGRRIFHVTTGEHVCKDIFNGFGERCRVLTDAVTYA